MTVQAKEVFEILMRENSDMLWAYLRACVFDTGAAEDIYQEAMIVAWRRLGDYDRSRPFGAWLRGIAARLVLAYFRKHSRRAVVLADADALDALAERFAALESRPADTWDERLDALRKCMERLNPQEQDILKRYYFQEQDCIEISQHCGSGIEAVKKRLQRSRAALAQCIRAALTPLASREVDHG